RNAHARARTERHRIVSHRKARWDFFSKKLSGIKSEFRWWCPGAELNHRHLHFQCSALPTELPGRRAPRADEEERGVYRGSIPGCPEQPATPFMCRMRDPRALQPASRLRLLLP